MNKRKIINLIAEIKIRLARGQGYFYELRNAIILSAGLKIMFDLSIMLSVVMTIILMIMFYLAGWLDYNKFKLAQVESKLLTSKYNPHLNKLSYLGKKT